MTDDIVTRLREHAAEGIVDFTKCSWDIQNAVDEIEMLRKSLKDALANNEFWRDAVHRATCPLCRGEIHDIDSR